MRRLLLLLTTCLAVLGLAVAPASAQAVNGDADNDAVAVNTEDGASIFEIAFSIVRVTDGVVDQTNTAVALASCVDCTTVALAFQVVLVDGDADVVAPENRSLAVNVECAECLTYASATQLVLGVDGPVRLTADGLRRLAAVANDLRELERDIDEVDVVELNSRVQAAEQELTLIFTEELVPRGQPEAREDGGVTTTTSTSTPSSTTSTTTAPDGSTSTTSSSTSTTTTSTTTPSTTTSTTAP